MSFTLLRRQQNRLQEVASSGTFDSVLATVEAAAAARSFTDEGKQVNRGARNKQKVWSDPADGNDNENQKNHNINNNKRNNNSNNGEASAEQQLLAQSHHGSISINEKVARKVAEARMVGDAKKNILDNQRRFLSSQMKPQHMKLINRAKQEGAELLRRKNDSGDPLAMQKKKKKNNNKKHFNNKKGKKSL